MGASLRQSVARPQSTSQQTEAEENSMAEEAQALISEKSA